MSEDDLLLELKLPCDVKVGGGTHRKGTSVWALVARMRSLHREAFPEHCSLTPEQKAANLALLRGEPATWPKSDATDVADIIAGALQTSRGHAYELMKRAIAERDQE